MTMLINSATSCMLIINGYDTSGVPDIIESTTEEIISFDNSGAINSGKLEPTASNNVIFTEYNSTNSGKIIVMPNSIQYNIMLKLQEKPYGVNGYKCNVILPIAGIMWEIINMVFTTKYSAPATISNTNGFSNAEFAFQYTKAQPYSLNPMNVLEMLNKYSNVNNLI